MGAGHIIEQNIKSTTSNLWNQLPQLQPKSWLDFDLKTYNKAFVNLAITVGVITLAKSALSLSCSTLSALNIKKVPSSKQLHQKYGYHSWALIADCRGNEEYCRFLAKNGFNLILMGEEKDIQIAKDKADHYGVQVQVYVLNWREEEQNIKFY